MVEEKVVVYLNDGVMFHNHLKSIQRIALRKLMMIDNAENIHDLRVPPANHLKQLFGDLKW